jgi:abnormal spindle-like microcephaly-associated protein
MRRLSATPCPVSFSSSDYGRRDSIFSTSNDTTADLDFTTEFKASFRDVKPRRPPAAAKRRARTTNAPVTIHEDEELKVEQKTAAASATSDMHHSSQVQRRNLSSRRVSFAQAAEQSLEPLPRSSRPSTLSKAPRRLSIRPPNMPEDHGNDTLPAIPATKISKPPRRGTVYIPSDDTTMPTMFMDIFSPLRKAPVTESKAQDASEADMTGIAMQMQRKKGPRKSILAVSPKRGPLQPTANTQASAAVYDRHGQGPGKENVPPGFNGNQTHDGKKSIKDQKAKVGRLDHVERSRVTHNAATRLYEPTASSTARTLQKQSSDSQTNKSSWNSNFLLPKPRRSLQPTAQGENDVPSLQHVQPAPRVPFVPTRTIMPLIEPQILPVCDFLPEGVVEASMYEENWLGQQEIAITQLINQLFSAASMSAGEGCPGDLERMRISEVYGTPSMIAVYRRIQDSLSQGALGISQDVLLQGQQLHADLGRRQAYTSFWLTTYDTQLLRSCLEVVVGRVIPSRTSNNYHSPIVKNVPKEQRSIQRFIEKHLIRNEDVTRQKDSDASVGVPYRRTVLRSLMLVKLLDMVKSDDCLRSKMNLFRMSSDVKSSHAALLNLMRLLNPSGGDATRALKNLGYAVTHIQYPLEEYCYTISNLAVDLRDGVRLTRLIELLLYQTASQSLNRTQDAETTTLLTVPSGYTVTLGEGDQDWPISQFLKLPCISRATKLYNVQLALSALKGVRGMAGVLQDIEPADIVDGFREKTVRLLWGLSSKWGLGGLVDWEDVKAEIKRLGRAMGRVGDLYLDEFDCEDEEEYLQYRNLLKAWVKAVAASRGLRVRNFTSDFADGRLFGVLISEYQPFLTNFGHHETSMSLPEQLRALGCSEEFGRLFVPVEKGMATAGGQQIFDRDFVLASLAFLCSRLLRPSKKARAAVVLQRAWRRRWEVVIAGRKEVLKQIALCCASQARMRQAKACIWRAWCEFRARRAQGSLSSREHQAAPEVDIWLSL